ncbi:MAG: hypothetical protein WAL47_17740 [Pyrinomonadaceae bacterium]
MQVCESTPDASRPVIGDGEGFLAELEKRELERMVVKRADSPYVGERTPKLRQGREEMRKRTEAWPL